MYLLTVWKAWSRRSRSCHVWFCLRLVFLAFRWLPDFYVLAWSPLLAMYTLRCFVCLSSLLRRTPVILVKDREAGCAESLGLQGLKWLTDQLTDRLTEQLQQLTLHLGPTLIISLNFFFHLILITPWKTLLFCHLEVRTSTYTSCGILLFIFLTAHTNKKPYWNFNFNQWSWKTFTWFIYITFVF